MSCQCQAIEGWFNHKVAARELRHYRRRGPNKTTRMLLDALRAESVVGATLLDIGGGVGVIAHELLEAGAASASNVEASTGYLAAAQEEAARRGHADRMYFRHGDFVDLAAEVPPADIVTLDRVVCCYPDMDLLVRRSSARARRLYGLVYPRDTWWIKLGFRIQNFWLSVLGNPFRIYVHSTEAVDAIVRQSRLERRFHRKTIVWQVVVYAR